MSRDLLLGCEGLSKAFGRAPLFEGLSFGLFEGDRVGLIGPNGSGKTTLLKILAGLDEPDSGTRAARRDVRFGYVPQDPEFPGGATVGGVMRAAADEAHHSEDEATALLSVTLGRAGFYDPEAEVATLSGGWKKRLAIARALVAAPHVLLLDEPTNHLDVEGILWLEGLLGSAARAVVVVSHDRYFLENVTTRVIEINRSYAEGLFACDGRYSDFLVRRDEVLRAQADYQKSLANIVRREIEWLQRGAKARSTKAQSRIREAGQKIEELDDLKSRSSTAVAKIDFAASERRSKRLLAARGLGMAYEGNPLFDELDLTLAPGTRVGLLGPNGCGKTTLLRVLAGEIEPDRGEIKRVEGLLVVSFQQDRRSLDPTARLRRALAPEGDTVEFRGRPLHVAGWARRFLFRPEQLEMPVGSLSGGEQARVLIARLMLEPADLLLLDEPTNDLDIPTLDVLEENLLEFPGAVVLVTHDRFLLDRVATTILALDGSGNVATFADLDQWRAARRDATKAAARAATTPARREAQGQKRLSYRERQEWEAMEGAILEAENGLVEREKALADPTVASNPAALEERHRAVEEARAAVARLYARWAELETKVSA